jgi:hypothetical protein
LPLAWAFARHAKRRKRAGILRFRNVADSERIVGKPEATHMSGIVAVPLIGAVLDPDACKESNARDTAKWQR